MGGLEHQSRAADEDFQYSGERASAAQGILARAGMDGSEHPCKSTAKCLPGPRSQHQEPEIKGAVTKMKQDLDKGSGASR